MNISDLTYNIKNGHSVSALIPISSIITKDDAMFYRENGYFIPFTCEEFKNKFPNLDENKFFCTNGMSSELIYYDINKLIYKRLIFNGQNYFLFDPELSEEEEIIKIINIYEELYKKKEWESLIFSAEGSMRFYLLNYGIENNIIAPEEIYELFIDVYTSTDYGSYILNNECINRIFEYKTELQKQNTKNTLSAFGNTLTVYRGEGDRNTDFSRAFSWTTDINVANFFATRLAQNKARIIKAKVKKSKILEYIDNRNESEILINPENVEVMEIIDLFNFGQISNEYINDYSLEEYDRYKSMLKSMVFFNSDLNDHGKIHCLRVLLNAIIIANHEKITDIYDRSILFTACICHDMARDHDYEDTLHGENSYRSLIDNLGLKENNELLFLMKYHCINDRHGLSALKSFPKDRQIILKKLLYILKDADALDRVRFGIRALDMTFLRIDFSKKLTLMALQSLKGIKL